MRYSRFALFLFPFLCLCALVSSAQRTGDDAISRAAISNGIADMSVRAPIAAESVQNGSPSQIVLDANTGAVVSGGFSVTLNSNAANSASQTTNDDRFDIDCRRPNHSNIDGLNTLATFDGAFAAQAGPSAGSDFRFTMVGNDPRLGCTTVIPAQIAEVDLALLNADGSLFKTVPFAPFETLTLESPNFEPLNYRSGKGIQYSDAVHRAQFFHNKGADWHTLLIPRVVDRVTISVPTFVNVQFPDGSIHSARAYFTGTAADGSTFVLMLDSLFNFFFDNLVINEINAGNFTTNGISFNMFPNTYLFSLNQNNPNTPGGCCVLGFHTYFRDNVFPQSRWVTQYASWISPGIFGNNSFQDVTALSHETAEIFGDPFINNPAPRWQFPGQPANSMVCQGNLEEGDPIEVLPNLTFPITAKEGAFKFIYHPQNIPLLQWFEMGTTSSAIDGAFSFPDETVLPHSAVPCPQ